MTKVQICQSHWDELLKALDERGLSKFISSRGSEFDPIATIIYNVERFGPAVDNSCPFCVVDKHLPHLENSRYYWQDSHEWIKFLAMAEYDDAIDLGLIPKQYGKDLHNDED